MIHFVVTRDHRYTLGKLLSGKLGRLDFEHRLWTYERLLRKRTIPGGTWIFQDIERLSHHEKSLTARIANTLTDAGARVLNHPAKACARYELLRRLARAGVNDFNAYRADEQVVPQRWPVFIRFENNHFSPDPKLLPDTESLAAELGDYQARSVPLSTLLIIEYCGEQNDQNLWRKYSAFRIGDEIIHHHIVHERHWVAKFGKTMEGIPDYILERNRMTERQFVESSGDPHGLLRIFQLGGLEFGRADFGFVESRPQIYEINTNPTLGAISADDDPCPQLPREPVIRAANHRLIAALGQLDQACDGSVGIARHTYHPLLPWRRTPRP